MWRPVLAIPLHLLSPPPLICSLGRFAPSHGRAAQMLVICRFQTNCYNSDQDDGYRHGPKGGFNGCRGEAPVAVLDVRQHNDSSEMNGKGWRMGVDRALPDEPWMHQLVTAGELQRATFLIFQGAQAHVTMEFSLDGSDRAAVALERTQELGTFISQLIEGEPDRGAAASK